MKTKKISRKMVLNKTTIANIANEKMQKLMAGGIADKVKQTWGKYSCETECRTLDYMEYCRPDLIWVCDDIEPPTS